jgi:hypothetical protein
VFGVWCLEMEGERGGEREKKEKSVTKKDKKRKNKKRGESRFCFEI